MLVHILVHYLVTSPLISSPSKGNNSESQTGCLTPIGEKRALDRTNPSKRILRLAAGGTSCIDVSSMGTQSGLLGPSCRPLAIFCSELKFLRPVSWKLVYIPFSLHNVGVAILCNVGFGLQIFCFYMILVLHRLVLHTFDFICIVYEPAVLAPSKNHQVLALHECTSRFVRSIFDHHLGHLYHVLPFFAPQDCFVYIYIYNM